MAYVNRKFYVVYLNDGKDTIVAVGSYRDCAKILGMSIENFSSTMSKTKKGIYHKYTFYELEEEDEN